MFHPHTGLASLLVALASASLIGGYIYLELQDPSPGQLSAVHAQVAQLEGGKNCGACHGPAGSAMKDACTTCHEEIAGQLAAGTGIHGRLPEPTRDQCATCHSEHQGLGLVPTTARSFELAGVPDVARFDHANLNFQLSGIHLQLECVKCHKLAAEHTLPANSHRFLGLQQNCQSCHDDIHRGQYGQDCDACHGQASPFGVVAKFQHSAGFPLSGSHANLRCQACHAPDSPQAVPTLLAHANTGLPPSPPRNCGDCHASTHSAEMLTAAAASRGLLVHQTCEVCHTPQHPTFLGPFATISPEVHAGLGFPLLAPHDNASCQQCHPHYGQGKSASTSPGLPPRQANDCAVCHRDPHAGQFADLGAGPPADCLSCHGSQQFAPAQFDAARHNTTHFPLHGAHADLHCHQCHTTRQLPASADRSKSEAEHVVRVFRGTPTSCRACHLDPHAGQFARDGIGGSDCTACHDDQSFTRSTLTAEKHNQTRFPLTGAHLAVGCFDCHREIEPAVGEAAALAKPSRHAHRRFQGTPTRCDGCHQDVHDGAFAAWVPGPGEVQRLDCSACHTTDRFDSIDGTTFGHAQATGFELRGAHQRLECVACHVPRTKPAADGRTFGRAAGRNCQDCHADPHAGQFGPTADVRCTNCHAEDDSFQHTTFDHQRDSKFSLDDVHRELSCAACHRPYRLPDGKIVVRYRPLGTHCADCHLPSSPDNARRQNK